jgi:fructose-1,6-bisphosphatase/inositol monophosphatase family enzyme
MKKSKAKTTNQKDAIDLRLVRKWLKEAGKFALAQRNLLRTDLKTDGTPVTDVDLHIESLLVDHISQTYPDHQILSEEGNSHSNNSEFLWTIDPIDGTRVYISGLPVWGISVGIFKQGSPYAGVFFMPATQEMYWGVGDKGFFNNQPMPLQNNIDMQNSLAFIAVPSNAHKHYEISFGRLRSLGSTTAHLAYVARGVAMAALTRRIYIWDLAAVLPLLKATGIGLVYLSGKAFDPHELLDGRPSPEPIVAAPVNIIEEVRTLIQVK